MGSLMIKELVKSRVFSVITVMAGSIFLGSCSSGISRFDMPVFGLSSSEDQAAPTASLAEGSRLGQGADEPSAFSDGGALAEFGDSRNSTGLANGSSNYNSRSSYLPPQTAAPEVRSARYNVKDRSPLSSFGTRREQGRTDTYAARGTSGGNQTAQPYDQRPMKPYKEARRSFLPAEPSQYNYNANAGSKSRTNSGRTNIAPSPAERRSTPRVISTQADGSQRISVGSGDTLYSIGRRHNVSVVKLMELNELSDSNLTVGQQLLVPGSARQILQARPAAKARTQTVRATSSGTYTVRPGENFQAIAGKLNIDAAKLADINGITDTGGIRAGEVLILPTVRKSVPRTAKLAKPLSKVRPRGAQDLKVRSVKTRSINLGVAKTKTIEKSNKTASVAVKRSSKKAAGVSAFRWPVRGRIIGKFGPRGDGTHNDGINLAVPNGTRVKAAEEGVVAYAGSELKGYGNLVLIRHADNWVSAYAHNDKLMVKRGDKIKRGQVVARAGTSGSVEQPQVHFELRKGSKPVDPTKYMAGT